MKETETPGTACTACGKKFDTASGLGDAEEIEPDTGGVSLCISCGNADIFEKVDGVLTLRAPTAEELESLNSDPTVRSAQAAIRGLRTWRKK